MKKYAVTIKAIVIKTIEVEANNESEASELAHESFSAANDLSDENYYEDTIRIKCLE